MKKLVFKLCAFLILLGFVFPAPAAFAAEVDSGAEDGAKWEVVSANQEFTRFQYHNAAALNGLVYSYGGYLGGSFTDKTIVYNPKTNEFHNASEMVLARCQFGSTVFEGKIYAFGGAADNADGITDTIEIFDPKTETWSMADSVMPTIKILPVVAAVGDKIYIIGGANREGKYQGTVDIYHPKTNTWTIGSPMPFGGLHYGCTVLQNKIYVFGGRDPKKLNTPFNQIYCYDPATDIWTQAGTMPKKLCLLSVSSYNNKAIIIGGTINNQGIMSDDTYIYDPATQACTPGPKLNTPRCLHASAVVGDTAYALYGYAIDPSGYNYATTIEKLNLSQLIPAPPASDNLTVLLNTEETIQLSVSNNLADNIDLTWTSTDSSVAQVDENGKVTAITPGECSISVETAGDAYREVIPVKVFDGDADQYRLAVNLQPAQTAKLHLTQDPASTVWTSHDTTVATVNSSGRVTAVANGLVIIDGEANSQSHHIYVRVRA